MHNFFFTEQKSGKLFELLHFLFLKNSKDFHICFLCRWDMCWFSQSESVIDIHHNQNLVRSGGKVVFLLSWKWVLRCFTPESKFAILLQSKSYEKFMNGIIHTSPSSFKSLDILLFRKNEIGAHPLFS